MSKSVKHFIEHCQPGFFPDANHGCVGVFSLNRFSDEKSASHYCKRHNSQLAFLDSKDKVGNSRSLNHFSIFLPSYNCLIWNLQNLLVRDIVKLGYNELGYNDSVITNSVITNKKFCPKWPFYNIKQPGYNEPRL